MDIIINVLVTSTPQSTLMPKALGHTSRLRRSILAPMALDPLRLLQASSEFPDKARYSFAAAYGRRAKRGARAALVNP